MKSLIACAIWLIATSAAFSLEIEPYKPKTKILFSLPFPEISNIRGSTPLPEPEAKDAICLADEFEPGLSIVLLNPIGMCTAQTAGTFQTEYGCHEMGLATRVIINGECPSNKPKGFSVAVIGVEPVAVRAKKSNEDKSALPDDLELKAREVARSGYQNAKGIQPVKDVADSAPEVYRVGQAVFMLFKCTDEFLNQDGLPVLVLNNNAFLLEGSCAFKWPFSFTVNNKLHISYWATVVCCGCGDSNFFVYDLSGETPEQVYHNGKFSN